MELGVVGDPALQRCERLVILQLVDIAYPEGHLRIQVVRVLLHCSFQAKDGLLVLVVLRMTHAQHPPRLAVLLLLQHHGLERMHGFVQLACHASDVDDTSAWCNTGAHSERDIDHGAHLG